MVTPPKIVAPRGVSINPDSAWILQEFAISTPTSTTFDILARFQQKQLQEKEQKLIELYDQQQQRAHQVAFRGSAGASDASHVVINNPSGKVRQMFEERRQQATRGIDKSFPLDPLQGRLRKQVSNIRRTFGGKTTTTKIDVPSHQRYSLSSRESNGSSIKSVSQESSRENISRESEASKRSNESVQRSNGHEIKNGETIHNETMQRNRKLQPVVLEPVVAEQKGDAVDAALEKTSTKKLSQLDRIKNPSPKKVNGTTGSRKPGIPTAANTRQSTLMNTTKSASLKIRKISRNRKTLGDKKTSNQAKRASKKQKTSKKRECSCDREKNSSATLSALKSTPLVREIIRNREKNVRSSNISLIGKVKSIVIKIENIASEIKNRSKASSKFSNDAESTRASPFESKKESQGSSGSPLSPSSRRPSIIDSDECKKNVKEAAKASPDKREDEQTLKRNGEGDEIDALIFQKDADAPASLGRKEEPLVDHSTERQKIRSADLSIKIDKRDDSPGDKSPRASVSCANRPRRASFEAKRMLFEKAQPQDQSLPRRDSVESALRHFDSIEVGSTERPRDVASTKGLAAQLSDKDSHDKNPELKGFERYTSSWIMKTLKGKPSRRARSFGKEVVTGRRAAASKKVGTPAKKIASGKLLEARDSIELTRISVKTRSPVCRRRRRTASDETEKVASTKVVQIEGNEESLVKNQSFLCNSRTTKNSTPDSITKKTEPKGENLKAKKSPFTPSKSTEDAPEEKPRAPGKSSSLKFLNHVVTGMPVESDSGRKSSGSEIEGLGLESVSTQQKDEKQVNSTPDGPKRGSPAVSSNANPGMNRSHGSTSTRSQNKAKSTDAVSSQRAAGGLKTNSNPTDLSLIRCKICGRRFSTERINHHMDICAKTTQKKRKTFDTVNQRVRGTELESYVTNPMSKKQIQQKTPKPQSNWRRKHEEFINTIRSAKQVQMHLDNGGKLSDLPPPPPSDTSDYVQCPHCQRRFNEAAASRHIPKCSTMQHNKGPVQRPTIKSRR